jgi:hypothetical protein
MRLEHCSGCNTFPANRTAPFLAVPDFHEHFSSFGAVQHFFSVTFLKIFRPFFIKRIGFGGNLFETDNFRVCRVFQFEVFLIEIFTAESRLCRKRPRSVVDVMPVFVGDPSFSLSLVSATRPLPKTFEYPVVN